MRINDLPFDIDPNLQNELEDKLSNEFEDNIVNVFGEYVVDSYPDAEECQRIAQIYTDAKAAYITALAEVIMYPDALDYLD